MPSSDERTPSAATEHAVQACYEDGEGHWSLVCDCQWEAWNQPTEKKARQAHSLHVLTALSEELPGGYR